MASTATTKRATTKKKPTTKTPPLAQKVALSWTFLVLAWWALTVASALLGVPTPFPPVLNPAWLLGVVLIPLWVLHTATIEKDGKRKDKDPAAQVNQALRAIKVIDKPKEGENAEKARLIEKPRRDGHGVVTVVELPRSSGSSWKAVAKKREEVAASMGLDADRVEIEQGKNSGQVSIWVEDAQRNIKPITSSMAGKTTAKWHEPVRIGETPRGVPVHYTTWESNGLFAGFMGSGKSVTARQPIAQFLLDPTATIHLFDGKGSENDWGPMKHACSTFVLGSEDNHLVALRQTLNDLIDLCRQRNAEPTAGRCADWRPDGVLLVVDEFQNYYLGLDRREQEDLTALFARVLSNGRAVGVHTIFITQRPTADTLPTMIRGRIQERVALKAADKVSLEIALGQGEVGTKRQPKLRGEALVKSTGEAVFARMDYLDDVSWRALCAGVPTAAQRAPTPAASATQVDPEPEPQVDPFVVAVRDALEDASEGRLTAAQMNEVLPAAFRGASAAALGRRLGDLGLRKTSVGNAKFYTLANLDDVHPQTATWTIVDEPVTPSAAPASEPRVAVRVLSGAPDDDIAARYGQRPWDGP